MTETEPTELSRLTLMCRDHEVIEFTWNHAKQAVTGKTRPLDVAHAPIMSLSPAGNITRDRLTSWFKNRSVPDFRPDALKRLRAIGFESAASLMASGFGASLSDQYWIKPLGSTASWKDINCFENNFSEELGELLLPHDDSSIPSLVKKIKSNIDVLASSPDAALNGNLPKRWEIDSAGRRIMVKAGRPANRFQEPFNEAIASDLCSRILDKGDYVTYSLRDNGFMKWTSACETMVDQLTEFVPAYAILSSSKVPSDQGLFDFYVDSCSAHGLDVKTGIEKMLVVDYLMANFDRHWNNFGLLIDTENREWLRPAPVFDTGVRECGQKVGPDWVQDWSPYGKLHARAEGTGGGALQRARLRHRNGAQARASQQAEALRLGEPRRRRPQAHLRRTLPALRPRNQVPGGRDVPRIRRCDDARRRPGRVQRRHRLQLGCFLQLNFLGFHNLFFSGFTA